METPPSSPVSPASPADRAVSALLDAGLLQAADREAATRTVAAALRPAADPRVSARSRPESEQSGASQLIEVVAYLGGTLIVAASLLFSQEVWDDLSNGERIALLVIGAVVLAVAGLVARGGGVLATLHPSRRRLASTLLTAASGIAGIAVIYAWDLSWDDAGSGIFWPTVAGAGLATALAYLGYLRSPGAPGLIGMFAGAWFTILALILGTSDDRFDLFAAVSLAYCAAWLALTELGFWKALTLPRFLGIGTALSTAQFLFVDNVDTDAAWSGYLATVAVAVIAVVLYLRTVDWPYLVAGVLAVALIVPEAVIDLTDGGFGVIGGVLLAGITLLGAALFGMKLRQEATDHD